MKSTSRFLAHRVFQFSSQVACGSLFAVRVRAATPSRPSPSQPDEARSAEETAFPGKLKGPVLVLTIV